MQAPARGTTAAGATGATGSVFASQQSECLMQAPQARNATEHTCVDTESTTRQSPGLSGWSHTSSEPPRGLAPLIGESPSVMLAGAVRGFLVGRAAAGAPAATAALSSCSHSRCEAPPPALAAVLLPLLLRPLLPPLLLRPPQLPLALDP